MLQRPEPTRQHSGKGLATRKVSRCDEKWKGQAERDCNQPTARKDRGLLTDESDNEKSRTQSKQKPRSFGLFKQRRERRTRGGGKSPLHARGFQQSHAEIQRQTSPKGAVPVVHDNKS